MLFLRKCIVIFPFSCVVEAYCTLSNMFFVLFVSVLFGFMKSAEYIVYLTYIYRVSIVYLSCIYRVCRLQMGYRRVAKMLSFARKGVVMRV